MSFVFTDIQPSHRKHVTIAHEASQGRIIGIVNSALVAVVIVLCIFLDWKRIHRNASNRKKRVKRTEIR